jgi:TPR repeat protein
MAAFPGDSGTRFSSSLASGIITISLLLLTLASEIRSSAEDSSSRIRTATRGTVSCCRKPARNPNSAVLATETEGSMCGKSIVMLLMVVCVGGLSVCGQTETPATTPAAGQGASQPANAGAVQPATKAPPAPPAPDVPSLKQKALAGDLAAELSAKAAEAAARGEKGRAAELNARAAELSAEAKAAQNKLGEVYAIGEGVPRNLPEAAKWFRKAAEQGDASAQLKLGVMYVGGFGVVRDVPEALLWYKKAAAQGSTEAMLELGKLYQHGLGVPKSGPEALNWYTKAADKGNVAGELQVGYIFRDGLEDVPHDYEQALKWFRKAAQQGNGEAEFNLGYLYQQGLGVVASVDQAEYWYKKAIQDNYPNAGIALRRLKSGSQPATSGGDVTASLENTYWKLTRLGETPICMASQQQEPHFVLDSESRRVNGSGGCNRLMGSYKLNGDQLTFSQMAGTKMACLEGMETENAFLDVLKKVNRWKITGQQLELFDAAGNLLASCEARRLK